jgi:hypothetical protein
MAGFSKIYIIGGSGGFLGSDGVNPIIVQILVGRSDGEWLEVNYLDPKYDSLCGIKKIIPRKAVDDDTILEGLLIFTPWLFIEKCDLMINLKNYFKKLGRKNINLHKDVPSFWDDLLIQAEPIFKEIKLFSADIKDLRPEKF